MSSIDHALPLLAGKYFQMVGFVVLIYDHILTFPQEVVLLLHSEGCYLTFSQKVERIWSQKINGATILFLINRYCTPLQFIVVIDGFVQLLMIQYGQSLLIMILRVYALYGRSIRILGFLMILLVVQVTLSAIGLSSTFRAPLPPPLVGCILTGTAKLLSTVWLTPLITDTCICILTLWRAREYICRTLHVFVRDGLLYFLVICMVNLFNTLMYFLATNDLKAIGASFSHMLTSTMISRLVLNLRSVADSSRFDGPTATRPMKFMTRAIGNLGEQLETILDDDPRDIIEDDVTLIEYSNQRNHAKV
ncbi:hypothetical protein L208DRAFT_1380139 [Tricholoma matsutake]|nr:hypothetical protein L208DRAFT_1380139 [Tricholoma matsutake 945]